MALEKKHKDRLLEILDAVTEICERNHIPYWLDGGTLLGAVRHSGFIPWDDDIDIGVMRYDYVHLFNVLKDQLPKNYFVQTRDTDPAYKYEFMKVRDTLSSNKMEFENRYSHSGLFIDIFPFDYVPRSNLIKRLHYLTAKINEVSSVYNANYLIGLNERTVSYKILIHVFFLLCKIFPQFIFNRINSFLRACVLNKENIGDGYVTPSFYFKSIRAHSTYFPLSRVIFQGKEYSAPCKPFEYLRTLYGPDFMIPRRDLHIDHIDL